MEIFVKDPSATVDYGIDWGAGYLSENEAINNSSWDIFPKEEDGDLMVHNVPDFSGTQTSIFIKGGIIRKIYRLTNRIITSAGRSDERTIIIKIGER